MAYFFVSSTSFFDVVGDSIPFLLAPCRSGKAPCVGGGKVWRVLSALGRGADGIFHVPPTGLQAATTCSARYQTDTREIALAYLQDALETRHQLKARVFDHFAIHLDRPLLELAVGF